MTIGKSPHRIQGKKGADEWDTQLAREPTPNDPAKPEAYEGSSDESLEARQIGGSRPGVESRVKDAIANREERQAE